MCGPASASSLSNRQRPIALRIGSSVSSLPRYANPEARIGGARKKVRLVVFVVPSETRREKAGTVLTPAHEAVPLVTFGPTTVSPKSHWGT